jgi:type IV secretory pathway VirB10-like protein
VFSSKVLVLTLVGSGCIAAAGVGGYLAVRDGMARPAAAAAGQVTAANASATDSPATSPSGASTSNPVPRADADDPHATSDRTASPDAVAETPGGRGAEMDPVGAGPSTVPRKAATRVAANANSASARDTNATTTRGRSATASPAAAPSLPTINAADVQESSVVELTRPEPAEPQYDDLTIAGDSIVGVRLETAVSSATARVEDRVSARVTRDVMVDGRVAVPAGSKLEGNVSMVQRGGHLRDRARVGLRFTTLVLPDNAHVPIQTEAIFRDGDAPGGESTAKIGASAVVGAILGGVFGGRRGAAIGGTAGAAGGTAAVMAGDPNEAVIPAGTLLNLRLTAPATILVPRN